MWESNLKPLTQDTTGTNHSLGTEDRVHQEVAQYKNWSKKWKLYGLMTPKARSILSYFPAVILWIMVKKHGLERELGEVQSKNRNKEIW